MVELVESVIDTKRVLDSVQHPGSGATVLFLGTTREFTDGRQTAMLSYEAYAAMAVQELEGLRQAAIDRWPLMAASIVHRLGLVPIGEASVAIAVSSPHRREAFEAGEWLINQLKERVPIWKQEQWADGTSEWIHPEAT